MSKVQALAEQWTHGGHGARERLRTMIEEGHRFDARDRMALAYLLNRQAPETGMPDPIIGRD